MRSDAGPDDLAGRDAPAWRHDMARRHDSLIRLAMVWLRCVGRFVPAPRRASWLAEWRGEIEHHVRVPSRRSGLDSPSTLDIVRRVAGAPIDAGFLRVQTLRTQGRRRAHAASSLGSSHLETAATILTLALPCMLAAIMIGTLLAQSSRSIDRGLILGTGALAGLSVLALAFVARRSGLLRRGRAEREVLVVSAIGCAVPGLVIGSAFLASFMEVVGQDPVSTPPLLLQLSVVAVLGLAILRVLQTIDGTPTRGPGARPWLQVCLGLAFLLGAFGALRYQHSLADREIGFGPSTVTAAWVTLGADDPVTVLDLLVAVRRMDGVSAASATSLPPLSRRGNEVVEFDGGSVVARGVEAQFFATLGHDFRGPAAGEAVVNRPWNDFFGPPGSTVGLADGGDLSVRSGAPAIQHFDPSDAIGPVLYYGLSDETRTFAVLVRSADRTIEGRLGEVLRAVAPTARLSTPFRLIALLEARLVWLDYLATLLIALGLCLASPALITMLAVGLSHRRQREPLGA